MNNEGYWTEGRSVWWYHDSDGEKLFLVRLVEIADTPPHFHYLARSSSPIVNIPTGDLEEAKALALILYAGRM